MFGDRITFKLTSEQTDGTCLLVEIFVVAAAGPPPHIHHREAEIFYVLEGNLSFSVGNYTIPAIPGTVVQIPKDIVHNFKNTGTTPARMLALFIPGGFEQYFVEIGVPTTSEDLTPAPMTQERLERALAAAPRYYLEYQ